MSTQKVVDMYKNEFVTRRYSEGFKLKILTELSTGKYSKSELSRLYGLRTSTINNWIKKYERSDLMNTRIMIENQDEISRIKALQKEIEQLRQEVQALRGLIEQQKVQNAQTATAIANVQRTAAAPVANPVLKTAKGAEFNLYGNVRLDASYQVEGGAKDMPYNQINGVPLEGNKEQSDRLRSTLSATRLGLDFKSPVGEQDVKGKLEVDFLGGANLDNLRIRHAYLNYGNWLIGQTWSNFAIPDYMPETIDALAYVGGAVKRTPQVRYTTKFSPQTNLVVAAEDPKDSSINQRLPALTARLNHQFADEEILLVE